MSTNRSEWSEGGRVVAGAAIALGTALPVWNYVSSLFTDPMIGEFGWTRGELSTASASAFLGSLAAPLAGRLADSFGVRKVLTVGLLGYALMFLALAFQPGSLRAYSLIILLHTGIGIACGGAIFSRAVAGWFERSRGLALGVTMAGVPLAAAVISPLVQWAITSGGWRSGFVLLAALAVLVGLPVSLWLIHERAAPPGPSNSPPGSVGGAGVDWPAIAHSRGFWLLTLSLLPVNLAGTGLMSAAAPILTDRGLTAGDAASLISLFAIVVMASRLASGFLLDRLPPHFVAALVTAAPAAGCLLLLNVEPSLTAAASAMALIGVQQGAEIDLVGYLLARMFGMKNYASAYGVCVSMLGLSGAAGVAWYGLSYDSAGTYDRAIATSIPCFLLGGALLWALRGSLGRPT